MDPSKTKFLPSGKEPEVEQFYYELSSSGETYYLLGTGIDGKPFTEDDILADLTLEEMEKLGYRVKGVTVE